METIDLDCAPGYPRPGDLIAGVIKGTGLKKSEPVSMLFGNWTWEYDIPHDKWVKNIQPIIKERITKLYNDGVIRYGSW